MRKSTRMRQILDRPGMLILPGVYDALSGKIVEEAGFEAVYMSGWSVAASFGKPDMGILTMTDVVSRAASITDVVDIPLICDIDTGYGNAINVIETIRAMERAGVAGVHMEDQVAPKKCGQFPGRTLISVDEMAGKLRAALDARTDPDFIVIARTDAVAPMGVAEAIRRGRAYIDAGADMIFVVMHQNPRILDEIKTVCSSFSKPTMVDLGSSPDATAPVEGLSNTGLKVALVTTALVFAAMTAVRQGARDMKQFGVAGIKTLKERNDSFESGKQLLGVNRIYELSERYGE
jgi:2,3-dimethylmalate lyase